jgi:hypothetical protein
VPRFRLDGSQNVYPQSADVERFRKRSATRLAGWYSLVLIEGASPNSDRRGPRQCEITGVIANVDHMDSRRCLLCSGQVRICQRIARRRFSHKGAAYQGEAASGCSRFAERVLR